MSTGGTTTADVSSAILRDAPAPAQSIRADLPPDLERIIGRCLEKDPELHIQTAKDVRNELELVRRAIGSSASAASSARQALPVAGAARTSSFQFKGKSEDLAVIGRKLNVATLLEGCVRKAGNRVRIAVQLVKTTLLGDEPDSNASGEVKAEVVAAAKGRGTDPEAHRLFLQGRDDPLCYNSLPSASHRPLASELRPPA